MFVLKTRQALTFLATIEGESRAMIERNVIRSCPLTGALGGANYAFVGSISQADQPAGHRGRASDRIADFGRRDFQVCTSSGHQRVAGKTTSVERLIGLAIVRMYGRGESCRYASNNLNSQLFQ